MDGSSRNSHLLRWISLASFERSLSRILQAKVNRIESGGMMFESPPRQSFCHAVDPFFVMWGLPWAHSAIFCQGQVCGDFKLVTPHRLTRSAELAHILFGFAFD